MATYSKDQTRRLFTKEQIGTHWNDLYENVATCLDYHFVLRRHTTHKVISSRIKPGDHVLDLGCGAGSLSEKLLDSGFHVVSADMSADMLAFTKERLSRFDPNDYNIVQTECESLQLDSGQFDLVACIGVFGYIEGVDRAIEEIHRVLKPGGTLIMSIRNQDHRRIFDIHVWLKPFIRLVKYFTGYVARSSKDSHSTPALEKAARKDAHAIEIWDIPKRVNGIFVSQRLRPVAFFGEGYGPITFRKRELLPTAANKFISRMLSTIFRVSGLERITRYYADISIYVFQK